VLLRLKVCARRSCRSIRGVHERIKGLSLGIGAISIGVHFSCGARLDIIYVGYLSRQFTRVEQYGTTRQRVAGAFHRELILAAAMVTSLLAFVVSSIGTASTIIIGWRSKRRDAEESKSRNSNFTIQKVKLGHYPHSIQIRTLPSFDTDRFVACLPRSNDICRKIKTTIIAINGRNGGRWLGPED
jgi:hypothetical protein